MPKVGDKVRVTSEGTVVSVSAPASTNKGIPTRPLTRIDI